jgi:hypothetical protein
LVRKSELLYNEISVADSTDGAIFSFAPSPITPLSTVAIAIKNTDATTRTITFEGLDRNNIYTVLECKNTNDSTDVATQTTATVSEVWVVNVAAFIGIRIKATTLTGGTLSLTATLIS